MLSLHTTYYLLPSPVCCQTLCWPVYIENTLKVKCGSINGFVGSIRDGDYKLIISSSREDLGAWGPGPGDQGDCFGSIMKYQIFNVKENPFEREDGNCNRPSACKSLHDVQE